MTTAANRVYEAVRRAIIAGQFAPGYHLTEAALADGLGVSRTPVREVLRRLHAEGLVDFVANQGAFVSAWSRTDLDDVFALRELLETHAAERAAGRLSPEQRAELARLQARMDIAARSSDADRLDRIALDNDRFHKLIIGAAGNARLAATQASLIDISVSWGTFSRYSAATLCRSMDHHRELLAAFAAGDGAWAASVMTAHISSARAVFTDEQAVAPERLE